MGVLSSNGSGFGMLPKFAPALIAGGVAYGGSMLLADLNGTISLPLIGDMSAPMAYGATVTIGALGADLTSRFILPHVPLPVSAYTMNQIVVPLVAGGLSSLVMSMYGPTNTANNGMIKLTVIGAGSYFIGERGAAMLGLNW